MVDSIADNYGKHSNAWLAAEDVSKYPVIIDLDIRDLNDRPLVYVAKRIDIDTNFEEAIGKIVATQDSVIEECQESKRCIYIADLEEEGMERLQERAVEWAQDHIKENGGADWDNVHTILDDNTPPKERLEFAKIQLESLRQPEVLGDVIRDVQLAIDLPYYRRDLKLEVQSSLLLKSSDVDHILKIIVPEGSHPDAKADYTIGGFHIDM